MRQRHLAGPGDLAAADQADIRDGVVRRAIGSRRDAGRVAGSSTPRHGGCASPRYYPAGLDCADPSAAHHVQQCGEAAVES
jgi:hypothetical protein